METSSNVPVADKECPPVSFSSHADNDLYIVLLKENTPTTTSIQAATSVRDRSTRVLLRHNIASKRMHTVLYNMHSGFIANLSSSEANELIADHEVEIVEQDRVLSLNTGCFTIVSPGTAQWGVNRVGAGDGSGKRVWVVDTGIDMDHPDLNVNQELSQSFVSNQTSPNDQNGHGTHVAGIIAALNNNFGVLGVASGVDLVALKVLNNEGEGNTSNIIKALNYIAQHAKPGDVVNMSLGADTISNSLDYAVKSLAEKGILFSLAAGNNRKDAAHTSPARVNHPNVFTVSAIDSVGRFAGFSNFGKDVVDFAAPGVHIVSTYIDGKYARLSGTSMAAPHVAGLLVLKGRNIRSNGFALNDPDGVPDPIASY
ncbi:MAG TPA: S8 family serine peptidase [Parasegetibacter sp.]